MALAERRSSWSGRSRGRWWSQVLEPLLQAAASTPMAARAAPAATRLVPRSIVRSRFRSCCAHGRHSPLTFDVPSVGRTDLHELRAGRPNGLPGQVPTVNDCSRALGRHCRSGSNGALPGRGVGRGVALLSAHRRLRSTGLLTRSFPPGPCTGKTSCPAGCGVSAIAAPLFPYAFAWATGETPGSISATTAWSTAGSTCP